MDSVAKADRFDRALGALVGIPEVISSRPSTIRATTPMIGAAQTFIIQTFRQREIGAEPGESPATRETIFLEYVDELGSNRLVIPPAVVALIHSQHDRLAKLARSRSAKAIAEDRKARGIVPGFMKSPRFKRRKSA